MKSNKLTATLVAGTFSLSMLLAGCGASQPAATTTAATTTAATTTAATTAAATTAATTGTAAEETILYWEGDTDKGYSVVYGEDDRDNTSSIMVVGTQEGKEEFLCYSGVAAVDNSNVTITDFETKETFTFAIVGATTDGFTIDLGERGKATLKPVSQKQFEDEVKKLADEANKLGEQVANMSEKDVEAFIAALGTAVVAESGTTATTGAATTAPATTTK
jgi:hypothetical protein